MTEAAWIACTDPVPMLEFASGRANDRRFRLFSIACCRRIEHLMLDRDCRRALDVAEQDADGLIADKIIYKTEAAMLAMIRRGPPETWSSVGDHARHCVVSAVQSALKRGYPDYVAARTARYASQAMNAVGCAGEGELQCRLVRDILGNPFRPVYLDPACRTGGVAEIALAIYAERAFERMPQLGDALARRGCIDPTILEHCRGPADHALGCWVVDAILGKS